MPTAPTRVVTLVVVPERVRTSMFARSETLLQLGWVIGGLIGIGLFSLDSTPRIGLLVIGALLITWLVLVVTKARRPEPAHPAPPAQNDDTRRF